MCIYVVGTCLLRLAASPPHLFLISSTPTWADPCPHLGLPLGGAWQDLRVPGLPTPVWVLPCKSPGALHSIHFPQGSHCPLSYEARETATTCVICEYIRLSAFALMLLRAGLAWAADRLCVFFFFFYWEEIYNFTVCMTYIYSWAS